MENEFSIQIADLKLIMTQVLFLIEALLLLAYLIKTHFGGLW